MLAIVKNVQFIGVLSKDIVAFKEYSVLLKEYVKPTDYLVYGNVGVIPYVTGAQIIDPIGIVDPYIASRKGCLIQGAREVVSQKYSYLSKADPDYIFGRKPKFIIIETFNNITDEPVENFDGVQIYDAQLYNHQEFSKYHKVFYSRKLGERYSTLFMRDNNS
jgi:hypothetical protein